MTQSVAKRSAASQRLLDAAATGRALMGGTRAMREAGETYLPKFEAETVESYRARLNSSWLFNGYRKTARDMTGRIFAKPVELGAGAPAQLVNWCMNADMAGRDLSTFAQAVCLDGLSGCGLAFIFVDAPPREGTVTRAQAERAGLRPYLTHVRVEDVLGWRTTTAGNATVLAQVRMAETITEPDPEDEFAEVKVEQVRVIDRGEGEQGARVRLYRKAAKAERWELHDEYLSGLPDITLVPFYANRTGFMDAEPLLDDLADVNVAHWQSQSDQRNILHFARVPVLFQSGVPEDERVVISAGMVSTASDPQADMKWVEHNGHAIGAGRQDLKDLEFQLETFGLQLLVAKTQHSATEAVLDAEKETSQLGMTADALKDALEQAMVYMARFGGLGDIAPEVEVNKDFGATTMSAQEATVLLSAVNSGQMSRDTFLRELARRGMIRPDLDVDEEAERLASQEPEQPEGEPMDFGASAADAIREALNG